MKNYFQEIENRLKAQIEFEHLKIIDNSHKHKKHKFFSPKKKHLHLIIRSNYLKSISRLSAQKLILKILKKDLENKIHALEISIE